MNQFSNCIVMVTGAASGIGRAVVQSFARQGAVIVAADIADSAVTEGSSKADSTIHRIQLDIADERAWRDSFARLQKTALSPTILVNCAGVMTVADVEGTDTALFDRIMSINARGTFLGCKYFLQARQAESGEGAIVNVASTAAIKPAPWVMAYAASKAAVVNLTRSVALQGSAMRPGVRCNAVLPGVVMTPMVRSMLDASPDPTAGLAALEAQHPIGRLVKADEVAAAVTFLASGQASGITGAALAVDGGMTAG